LWSPAGKEKKEKALHQGALSASGAPVVFPIGFCHAFVCGPRKRREMADAELGLPALGRKADFACPGFLEIEVEKWGRRMAGPHRPCFFEPFVTSEAIICPRRLAFARFFRVVAPKPRDFAPSILFDVFRDPPPSFHHSTGGGPLVFVKKTTPVDLPWRDQIRMFL